ncbi:nuclear transport factor 2 family protein [Winogradskyella sp. PE311]|uniref:nuclear transport factor 2 family protein n=1 Tax=Winogradskyella sp. PE311 TaxID=3366943 RepID=UPI00398091F1
MKQLLLILAIFFGLTLTAQESEKENVKNTITTFFNAFHKQDTSALKSMVSYKIVLQSVSINKEGKTVLRQDDFNKFITSIASIPKAKKFEEKLTSFSIQVDGPMANAWVGYEFWFDGNFSHCGVNSFQLIKENKAWKIIYLVDTRRKEDCEN